MVTSRILIVSLVFVLSASFSTVGLLGNPLPAAAAGTLGWDCTSGNTASACTRTDLPADPATRDSLGGATAPCPESADTCVYGIGGLDPYSSGSPVEATVEAYDTQTNTWASSDAGGSCASTTLACMPTARSHLAATAAPCPASTKTCVYALGGVDANTQPHSTFQAYNTATNTWTSSDTGGDCASAALSCMPTARQYLGASTAPCPAAEGAYGDTCVYAIGGMDQLDVTLQTVDAYDTTTNSWVSSGSGGTCASAVPACMPAARYELTTAVGPCPGSPDPCVYAIGGLDSNSAVSATIQAYDPRTNTWISSDTGGACASSVLACLPAPQFDLAAATAPCPQSGGTCVYALGGYTSLGTPAAATLEAYKPATNAWISSDAGGSCASVTLTCMPTARGSFIAASAPCPQVPGAPTTTCVYADGGDAANGAFTTAFEAYIPALVPDAPTSVTATPAADVLTNDAITLSWTAPTRDGGSPVTEYDVTCLDQTADTLGCPSGGSVLKVTGSPPSTSLQIDTLTAGHTYRFTVTAVNATGASVLSEPSNALPFYAASGTVTFTSTGMEQTFPVPAGINSVRITAVGAPGGMAPSEGYPVQYATGGHGDTVTTYAVPIPNGVKTLYIEVGGAGGDGGNSSGSGGWNGGGAAGTVGTTAYYGTGGAGGGGASDVRTCSRFSTSRDTLASRLIVAGGGGGGGGSTAACEGDLGGDTGLAGHLSPYSCDGGNDGDGATTTAGGAAGSAVGQGAAGTAGALGLGGGGGGYVVSLYGGAQAAAVVAAVTTAAEAAAAPSTSPVVAAAADRASSMLEPTRP